MNKSSIKGMLALAILGALGLNCRDDKVDPVSYSSIQGEVISSKTGEALSDVSITTNPSTIALLTDSGGMFYISSVPVGAYSIVAKKSGFRSESVSITVQNNRNNAVFISMSPDDDYVDFQLPYNPHPEDEAINQALSVELSWKAPEIDGESNFTYEVKLYDQLNALNKQIFSAGSDTSLQIDDLNYATTYFWQVNTTHPDGDVLPGEVWSFTTISFPDNRFLFASNSSGRYQVYSSDSLGKSKIRITNSNYRDYYPRWSPNRDLIAFTSDANVNPYIYTVSAKGEGRNRVSPLPVVGYHNQGIGYCWSPDGGMLLFSNYEKLYKVYRNGTGLSLVATAPLGRHFRQCDWTAQGDRIVVETVGSNINDNEFYTMDADGSNMKQLLGNWKGIISSPSFSIDGNYLLFTHDESGYESPDGRQLDASILLMLLSDTSVVMDLSMTKPDGTNDLQPRFSPDGSAVIFTHSSNDGSGSKDIYKVDINSHGRVKLFSNAEMPDWQ